MPSPKITQLSFKPVEDKGPMPPTTLDPKTPLIVVDLQKGLLAKRSA
jgi:hypothetical protein